MKMSSKIINKLMSDVEDRFIAFFLKMGLDFHAPEALIPSNDSSLLFTNSTIVPLKKYLGSGSAFSPGFVIGQDCLRSQNLRKIMSIDEKLEYMSYFRMLGVLVSPEFVDELFDWVQIYLTSIENIPAERIACKISTQDNRILDLWKNKLPNSKLYKNTECEEFYKWSYGVDGLHGRGLTIEIGGSNGRCKPIGNIIEIVKDGRVLGYEFGFGIETYLARKLGFSTPFETSIILPCCSFPKNDDGYKLMDCIAAAAAIANCNVSAGSGGRSGLLRRLLYSIILLCHRNSIELSAALEAFNLFSLVQFENSQTTGRIKFYLDLYVRRYEQACSRFNAYARNQVSLKFDNFVSHHESLYLKLIKKGTDCYGLSKDYVCKVIDSIVCEERYESC